MTVEIIDFGSMVLCDFCNEEHTAEKTALGGVLIKSSYAICPKCVARATKLRSSEIVARAGETETFHAFCMRLRGGDNTVKIYSKD